MSWRDDLKAASFRGVPFLVQSSSATTGRRAVVHEFPGRDVPYVEDLGRSTEPFAVEAYVIGADYISRRNALINALRASGPGDLVHPYYGSLSVQVVGDVTVSERSAEGGMARFSIRFYPTSSVVYPSAEATQAGVNAAADAAATTAQAVAADEIDNGGPQWTFESLTADVQRLAQQLDALSKQATLPDALTDLTDAVADLANNAAALILTPAALAGQINTVVAQLEIAFANPSAALDVVQQLFGYGNGDAPASSSSTPAAQTANANQAALAVLTQRLALSSAARLSAGIDYASYDDAAAVRDLIIDACDALGDTADDDWYLSLQALRTAVVTDIRSRAANLARIVYIELADPVPALALSYQRYATPDRDAEIIARNALHDPLFVDAGRILELLSD